MIYIIERLFESKLLAMSLTTVNNWMASKFKCSIFWNLCACTLHISMQTINACAQNIGKTAVQMRNSCVLKGKLPNWHNKRQNNQKNYYKQNS